jgi:hypothetical protein
MGVKVAETEAAAKQREETMARDHAESLMETESAAKQREEAMARDNAESLEEARADQKTESESAVASQWKRKLEAQAKQHTVELKWSMDAKENHLTTKMNGKLEQLTAHHRLTMQEMKQVSQRLQA